MFPPGQATQVAEIPAEVHSTQPAFGGHQNFYGVAASMPSVPTLFVGPPPSVVYPASNVGAAFGLPTAPPPFGGTIPQLGMLPHQAQQLPPALPQPPQPSQPPQEQQPSAPYFDLPAGIMTTLVGVDDFGYKPIEISKIRMPLVPLPDDRLLQALDAFYAPASHANPRNADGWEQLGLYEFFKRKSAARKEYEAKYGSISIETKVDKHKVNEGGLNLEKENLEAIADKVNKTLEQEHQKKRKYKQFREEKEVR